MNIAGFALVGAVLGAIDSKVKDSILASENEPTEGNTYWRSIVNGALTGVVLGMQLERAERVVITSLGIKSHEIPNIQKYLSGAVVLTAWKTLENRVMANYLAQRIEEFNETEI